MQENSSLFSLSIDLSAKSHLSEVARWARILSIAGIIFVLIIVVNGVYSSSLMAALDGDDYSRRTDTATTVGEILGIVLITVIPLLSFIFLMQFSNALKKGLLADDQDELNNSFKRLKIYFRYIAILTLLFIVFMGLAFILKLTSSVN